MSYLHSLLVVGLSVSSFSSLVCSENETVVQTIKDSREQASALAQEEAVSMHKMRNPAEIVAAPSERNEDLYKSVVKIEVGTQDVDFELPWRQGNYGGGRGTGFLIAPNLFLTNAHVVSNAKQVFVSQYGDSRNIPGKVLFIAHDCDLALVSVDDYSTFKNLKPFKLGKLPKLEDEVRALGYPIGGDRLSVTRGVVSRIDTRTYSHSMANDHLVLQIDAAINPGNSGGPVLLGKEVVGVAFQGLTNADNTGYVIPVPVIKHFLNDVQDGKYDGYVSMGWAPFEVQNPAMRQYFGLTRGDTTGVLVGDIMKGSGADGILRVGDLVLEIDGHPVDNSGMIQFDNEIMKMDELADRKFSGDKMTVKIKRQGQIMEKTMILSPLKRLSFLAASYDKKPRYVVYGGIVFQDLNRDTINAHKINSEEIQKDFDDFLLGKGNDDREEIVVATGILKDSVNAYMGECKGAIVESVNGVSVKGLSHLYDLLHHKDKNTVDEQKSLKSNLDFIVLKFKGVSRPIVFNVPATDEANRRIEQQYDVVKDHYLSK